MSIKVGGANAGGGIGPGYGAIGGVDGDGGPNGLQQPNGPEAEVSGVEGAQPIPGGMAPTTPTAPDEAGTEGVGAAKARDPKLAKEARDRHLADPQASQWQFQLQGQFADPNGMDPAREVDPAEKGGKKGAKPQDRDLADQLRGTIEELRGEARAYRAGAVELLNGSTMPTSDDALDSMKYTALAAADDAEANALEPKLREEEMKRRVIELEPLQPTRGAPPAASPVGVA